MGEAVTVEVAPHPTYDQFAQTSDPIDIEVARQSLGLSASRVLLFFGLIRPYKGLSVLLDAFGLLQTQDVQLIVAGECYQDANRYRRHIEDLGLTQRIHFHDRYIPNEEVSKYFSAADVVVLPYLSATGSGIVQIAFAFGVPVIVSAVGGIPELVQDNRTGLLVPPDDPNALAGAVDRFYREDLAHQLQLGIESSRESFGWETVVDAIIRCHHITRLSGD